MSKPIIDRALRREGIAYLVRTEPERQWKKDGVVVAAFGGRTLADCPTEEAAQAARRLLSGEAGEAAVGPGDLGGLAGQIKVVLGTGGDFQWTRPVYTDEQRILSELRALLGARDGELVHEAARRVMAELTALKNDALARRYRD